VEASVRIRPRVLGIMSLSKRVMDTKAVWGLVDDLNSMLNKVR